MNIFLINWDYNYKYAQATAKKLENSGHEIIYWTGSLNEPTEETRRKFPNTIFHKHYDAREGKPAKDFADVEFAPPGEDIIKNFYSTESILSTLKQIEKSHKSGFEKKSDYHSQLQYWLGVINKLKPEAIIFAICPHTGFDFIIYSIAKFLKIKTILFQYTLIADRHILLNEFTVSSKLLKTEIEKNKEKKYEVNDLPLDIKNHYLSQTDKSFDPAPGKLKTTKKRYSGVNLLLVRLKLAARSILDFSIFKKVYFFAKKNIGPNYHKEYLKLQSEMDFDKKFVYAPLHYQPECATAPLGTVFVDQILMIKILAAVIPDDWVVYVKEHPYQWLMQGINYTNSRYPGYFEKIAKIKKVKLIPIEIETTELIKKSQVVATITGTVGWESVVRKKPVLMFGYPWYRDAPGIFKVNNVSSCQTALDKINSGLTIKEQDIINYLISFGNISVHTSFERTSDIIRLTMTPEEYADNLAEPIIKDIKDNK